MPDAILGRLPRGLALLLALAPLACSGEAPDADAPPEPSAPASRGESYRLGFCMLLGGSGFEQARGVAVDPQGNIVVVGGTTSRDFPTTQGTPLRTDGSDATDAFIVKLDAQGRLIWSRLLGGPHHDRAYDVEVDRDGGIYVAGRAGADFPTTAGAAQPGFGGGPGGVYGPQDGFVARLSPDGATLWSTYYGGDDGMAVDDIFLGASGEILVGSNAQRPHPHHRISASAYQRRIRGEQDMLIAKLSADGSTILAASYYGGSGSVNSHVSVMADAAGNIYALQGTDSRDAPTTPGVLQREFAGGESDMILIKLSPDLSRLLQATYFGGNGKDFSEGFTLDVDDRQRPYIAVSTFSTNLLERPGYDGISWQTSNAGQEDTFVGILSADFQTLVKGTYLGGSEKDREPQGLFRDAAGNVIVTGSAASTDFPVTPGGGNPAGADAYVSVFSPDLDALVYSHLLGGEGYDAARISVVDAQRNIVVAGETSSRDFPTRVDGQGSYDGSRFQGGQADSFVARFIHVGQGASPQD